jgi:hydroxymethylbilane synthase
VDTRLQKLRAGNYDAIVLALAGLKRLGLESEVTQILDPEIMMPAPGQGCLGLELREGDVATLEILKKIEDHSASLTARAERAFLQGVGGNCLIPIGSTVKILKDEMEMKAVILDLEGHESIRATQMGPLDQPELVGGQLAERLLHEGGSEILIKTESAVGSNE